MAKFDHDTKKVYKPVCRVLKKETFPLPLVIVALKKKNLIFQNSAKIKDFNRRLWKINRKVKVYSS